MHNQSCKYGCEFAYQLHLMSYANKNADGTYSDADYLYKCTKLDRVISLDSTVYELGCMSYNNKCQNAKVCEAEALVAEVEKKLDEIEKIMPVVVPVMVPDPVIPGVVAEKPAEPTVVQPTVERVEPRFIPEPTVVQSVPQGAPAEKSELRKKQVEGTRTLVV